MSKKLILLGVCMALSISAFAADRADQVLTAFKAKKEKDVATLVQSMATDLDFAGLEKVREKAPEVFDVKYFPSEFVSGVIFKYVETRAAQQKPVPVAKAGTANPNKKGTWQYVYFDLQKAWATREKTTDPATLEKLTAQVNQYAAQLEGLMANMGYEQKMQVGMAIALLGLSSLGQEDSPQVSLQNLNDQFSDQALEILEYLFKTGIPFPSKLPTALTLTDWQREVSAFDFYVQITVPSKKSEFESDKEYADRYAEVLCAKRDLHH